LKIFGNGCSSSIAIYYKVYAICSWVFMHGCLCKLPVQHKLLHWPCVQKLCAQVSLCFRQFLLGWCQWDSFRWWICFTWGM